MKRLLRNYEMEFPASWHGFNGAGYTQWQKNLDHTGGGKVAREWRKECVHIVWTNTAHVKKGNYMSDKVTVNCTVQDGAILPVSQDRRRGRRGHMRFLKEEIFIEPGRSSLVPTGLSFRIFLLAMSSSSPQKRTCCKEWCYCSEHTGHYRQWLSWRSKGDSHKSWRHTICRA